MLRTLFSPSSAVPVFVLALVLMYIFIPIYVYFFDNGDIYNLDLMKMCFIACIMVVIGSSIPLFDTMAQSRQLKFEFNQAFFSKLIVVCFTAFLILTFATAEEIPLISAFTGASANELSDQRGALFKGREGWQIALLYLFTFFSQAMMPYAVADQFIRRDRWRFYSLGIFFIFTISFLQKFLFVNALLPLIFAYSITQHKTRRTLIIAVFAAPLILYGLTALAMGSDDTGSVASGLGTFFSADYQPATAIDTLFWRIFAVPVFTATDTLHVFYERLGGAQLYGATSNFIASLVGMERINVERHVFEYQWGWNDTANSNAVYFVDAFINFGWGGVCFISLIIGQSLRWFRTCEDLAIKSLWPLYCFGLYNATFIGMLFSNGYLLIWFMMLFTAPAMRAKGQKGTFLRRPPSALPL